MLVEEFREFVVGSLGFSFIARPQRLSGTVLEMVLHENPLYRAQGLMDGGHLHQHVRAIALFFHHLLDTSDLSLNAPEPQKHVVIDPAVTMESAP
jgi:hypothetical protein